MAFNIERFRSNIASYVYLNSCNFELYVATPPSLFNALIGTNKNTVGSSNIAKNLAMRIDQVRAPGISLMTADVNRYGIGPTQKMPFSSQNQEVSFSILVDEYGEIWNYWHNWVRSIFEFCGTDNSAGAVRNQIANYQVEYKDKYSAPMQIAMYDHYGRDVQYINLIEAFPTSIREVPLSWADTQLIKLNVSIAYTEYQIQTSSAERQPTMPSRAPAQAESSNTIRIRP